MFLEGRGAGRENLFPKRFPSPQNFLQKFSPASNLPTSTCRLCRVTFPLGNDHETTTPVSLPPGTVLLPGSGRHKRLGQAWVAGQHLIPAPTKNPRLIPGTIDNTRRAGDLLCRAVAPTGSRHMDACPQGGRAGGDGRPLPVVHDGTGDLHHGQNKRTSPAVLHAGTPQTSGSRRKGMLGKTRR